MKSLLLESLFLLLLSYQVLCSVWPNNKPRYTNSYLPPAVQILHVQTERLNEIRAATSTTTEAITTTPSVTCRPPTEGGSVDECQSYSGPPEAAPAELIDELDGELNATTPLPPPPPTPTPMPPETNVTNQLTNATTHDPELKEEEEEELGVEEEGGEEDEELGVEEGEGEEELGVEGGEEEQGMEELEGGDLEVSELEEDLEGGGDTEEDVVKEEEATRVTALSNERESNSTSNKEDEENSDILIPILALERLRDILTADVKRQGLSKVQGYSEELLETLVTSSTYSSRNQLRLVLIRMLKRGDAERRDSILMTKKIIEKLKDPESPLSSALQLVPPLMFT